MDDLLEGFKPTKKSTAYRGKKNLAILHAFLESGETCVCKKYESERVANLAYQGMRRAKNRNSMPIDVIRRNNELDKVYLVLKEPAECDPAKERTCQMIPNPDYNFLTCSVCGYEEEKLLLFPTGSPQKFDGKFCPNCGAKVVELGGDE